MLRDQSGTWSFRIEIGKFFTPPNEPNMRALEADLRFASAAAPVRMTYRVYLFLFAARCIGGPSSAGTCRPSPVITMWIPASATRTYPDKILTLTPETR